MHVAKKRLGQHFLTDETIIDKILNCLRATPNMTWVEVGPGLGAITAPLLEMVKRLHVVEFDRDVIPPLKARCALLGELHVHQADALKFDFHAISDAPSNPVSLVGNLPYNISTPLLFHFLKYADIISVMYLMLQKEVVQRMAASPGSKAYGRLSVMLQYYATVQPLFDIPPSAFSPPPKVDSAFVKVSPYETLPHVAQDVSLLEKVVTQAFSLRRKTLSNALKACATPAQLEAVGIDPKLRPEQLSVADFVALSNSLA